MFEAFQIKTAALKAQMEELRKQAAAEMKPMLLSFMKETPQVKAVKWTQYTPYFNDGEPCEFRVNDPEFYFDGDDQEDEGHSTWTLGRSDYGPKPEQCSAETNAACNAFAKALEGMDEALETLFGDHCRVIVTADGVEVDEYDHD